MNSNYDKLLRDELKKLVSNNKINITDTNGNYLVVIKGVTITVPKINNSITRSNLIGNK